MQSAGSAFSHFLLAQLQGERFSCPHSAEEEVRHGELLVTALGGPELGSVCLS